MLSGSFPDGTIRLHQSTCLHYFVFVFCVIAKTKKSQQPTTTTIITTMATMPSPTEPPPQAEDETQTSPCHIDFSNVTWSDLDEESGTGQATGVLGKRWSLLSSKQHRTVCSQLSIRGVKNVKNAAVLGSKTTIVVVAKVGCEQC